MSCSVQQKVTGPYTRVGPTLTGRMNIAPTWTKDRTRSTPKWIAATKPHNLKVEGGEAQPGCRPKPFAARRQRVYDAPREGQRPRLSPPGLVPVGWRRAARPSMEDVLSSCP